MMVLWNDVLKVCTSGKASDDKMQMQGDNELKM